MRVTVINRSRDGCGAGERWTPRWTPRLGPLYPTERSFFPGRCLDSSRTSASVAADVRAQVLSIGLFWLRRSSSGGTCTLTDLNRPPSDRTFLQPHYCCLSDFIRSSSLPDIICGMTIMTWPHGLGIKDSTSINHMKHNFYY